MSLFLGVLGGAGLCMCFRGKLSSLFFSMRIITLFNFLMACILTVVGTSGTLRAEKSSLPILNEAGQKLEAKYSSILAELKEELINEIPAADAERRSAFLKARTLETAAVDEVKMAQKRMDDISTARALVGHAKGKWIGGARRGISNAEAMLKSAKNDSEKEAAQKELAKWKQNLIDGENALRERQANFDKAEKERPEAEKTLKLPKQNLTDAKAASLKAVKNLNLTTPLSKNTLDSKLARYVLLLEATPHRLAAFAQQGKNQETLVNKMLSNDSLVIQMVANDGAKGGRYGEAMEIYQGILNASSKSPKGALNRLALAVALEHAEPVKQRNAVAKKDAPAFVDPVKRYMHYEKAFLNGELDPAFAKLSTWDYRMIVNGEEPDEVLAWGREMLRTYRPDHIATKDYRWRYVAAVRSDVRYGSQDNKYDKDELQFFQNILMNGGVCGRRAFFGRFILRCFGIPTTARPQRGHAALAHWTPDGWVVCLGGGWGSGWTKTRYNKDLDFLATTQARTSGDKYLLVKRAQWIGDVMGESKVYGFISGEPDFWHAVSLYIQKNIITEAKAETLAAVGEDIGEANVTKEKVEIPKVNLTNMDRKISIDTKGVITIPAAATSNPKKSSGKIIIMDSYKGGKQLHYSRSNGQQSFEYKVHSPASGKYLLTARIATPSWKQSLLLSVNGEKKLSTIKLPHTVGLWDDSQPVEITLTKGENVLTFSRKGDVKGLSIKHLTLTPVMRK